MSELSTAAEWNATVVDLSDDSTTVYTGSCLFRGASVHTVLSGQVCPIQDNATVIAAFPATAAVGSEIKGWDQRILTSLIVNPDDAATGMITVVWKWPCRRMSAVCRRSTAW